MIEVQVFVTGASGFIGSVVLPELIAAGHTVVGLARSAEASAAVSRLGAEVVEGDLNDLEVLAAAARRCDAVVHLAFDHGLQNSGRLDRAAGVDLAAVDAIGSALVGSGKPFVGTSATGALAMGGYAGVLTEDDTLGGGPRIDAENAVIGFAARGVRSCVVRLPPTVHGAGRFGFGSGLIETARGHGASAYVGDGSNRWPSAGVEDVARVYRLALESAEGGERFHAVAETGVALRSIAETIGAGLELPAVSIRAADAAEHFGPLSAFVGLDNPTTSEITRRTLGWDPVEAGLLDDLVRHLG